MKQGIEYVAAVIGCALMAPGIANGEDRKFDLSKERVLYCVGYAHLDTQWRWDFCTTIDQYIRDTLDQNFERFEQFPEYVFNFTGSVRYEMMKEYYPEKYAKLKDYISKGRWFVSGSSVDEGDVNVPSAEAIIRQVLYGNNFFRDEFGKESVDFMLPDCFGFPASLPSIWAHCGLKGFSTQKLTWGSAVGIPFKIGIWEGPDGRSIMAALDPGSYSGAIEGRVDTHEQWVARVEENGRKYGVWADFHYYGVGDQGGAPLEKDVKNYIASMGKPDSKIRVALTSSDQMFKDITAEQVGRLPRYRGDLLLTEHSAGTLTSQAYMKRWNRKNEQLADAAERAAVVANWLGAAEYPREKINRAWTRVLGNQMHDILPGTSIPRAYTYSWNDEIVAMNLFADVLQTSVSAVSHALDTRAQGQPLLVYNPLAIAREDLVEATVRFEKLPEAVRIYDPEGNETPSQIIAKDPNAIRVVFVARVPSVSFSVFDVRPAAAPFADQSSLKIGPRGLENDYFRLSINEEGDVASILDKKKSRRQVLAAPARLVFTHERPRKWPAWNMDWADRRKPPTGAVEGPVLARIVENGPVRVALEIRRSARNSTFKQIIRLARGDAGRRIEFKNEVDWQSVECALKASFPLTASNPKATYNWGMGTIDRGNNEPTKYEVPSHEWLDLTDRSGNHGVSILEDCKYGSDKPADHEVRLTLLYTPGVRRGYLDQHSQDWGRHEFTYAIYPHDKSWREARTEWQARRLNQPLMPFQVTSHAGSLGKSFSFLKVNTDQVDVRALKLAEHGNAIIIRLQELLGQPSEAIQIQFASETLKAVEVDGQERGIGPPRVGNASIVSKLTPFSPRSYLAQLDPPKSAFRPPETRIISLSCNEDVTSPDANRAEGKMDGEGRSLPAELLPARIMDGGIAFQLAPLDNKEPNVVACRGQRIELPPGKFNRLYFLAAATEDVQNRFQIDSSSTMLRIQKWTDFIGQFDDRIWDRTFQEVDYRCEGKVTGFRTGFIKRDPITWFSTHRHHATRGNEAYRFCYLYRYGLDIKPFAKALTLPVEPRIKIFAMTLTRQPIDDATPAAPLYDDFSGRKAIELRHIYPAPPVPVFEGIEPIARVTTERAESFEKLGLGPPARTDYIDLASGHGIAFRYFEGDDLYPPHPHAGAIDGTLPRLNDGEAAHNDDDTERSAWYDNEGRFFADLKRPCRIERINTYSRHKDNRALQYFSVWGASDKMPDPGFQHGRHKGWTLLGVVDTRKLPPGGVHASSVTAPAGDLGPFQYLLWVAEDVGEGTFFSEIDVHVAK